MQGEARGYSAQEADVAPIPALPPSSVLGKLVSLKWPHGPHLCRSLLFGLQETIVEASQNIAFSEQDRKKLPLES